MHEYQKTNRYFAQTADDIKDLASEELYGLGAKDISPAYRGIYFSAGKEVLYRVNYCTKCTSRILAPIITFNCDSPDTLYEMAKKVQWTDFISAKETFAIFSNVSNSRISNSHYASLRLKDGIVDSFRDKTGERPNVDARNPDIWLNLHIRNDKAVISLDTSGGSLHRRGYRKDAVEAPMQEMVAAAMIRYSEWDGTVPLYDPMCGSGTLLAEALMQYCSIPSGYLRDTFGFEHMPDFDITLWLDIKKQLGLLIRNLPEGHIAGSDISSEAVAIAAANINNIPQGDKIRLGINDFRDLGELESRVIITNPPYGIRTGNRPDLDNLFKEFGDFLKQRCKGSSAFIYFGDRELIKKVGLKPKWKKPLKTGGLDGRLVKYELY